MNSVIYQIVEMNIDKSMTALNFLEIMNFVNTKDITNSVPLYFISSKNIEMKSAFMQK